MPRSVLPPRAFGGVRPTFTVNFTDNGVDKLSPTLTINSIAVEPMLRYKGGDATATTWPAWGYGPSLTQSGTAATLNSGSPLLGPNDDSVNFNGGFYLAGNTTSGNLTTEDICVEAVLQADTDGTVNGIFQKRDGTNAGWQLDFGAPDTIRFLLEDTSTNVQVVTTGTVDQNTWCHVMAFVNRSEGSTNGSQMYVNGVASGTGVNFTTVGTCTNANEVYVGALDTGSSPMSTSVAYLAMWKRATWFQEGASGPTEWATIAAKRFAQLTGVYASKADTQVPTFTRAAAADLTNNDGTFSVFDNWPRVEPNGYLSEAAAGDSGLKYTHAISGAGSIVSRILLPDEDTSILQFIFDGDPVGDRHVCVITTADSPEYVIFDDTVAQCDMNGTTDVSDGNLHTISCSFATNNGSLNIDSAEEDTDTEMTLPDMTDIIVGTDRSNANNFEGHILELKIYPKAGVKS